MPELLFRFNQFQRRKREAGFLPPHVVCEIQLFRGGKLLAVEPEIHPQTDPMGAAEGGTDDCYRRLRRKFVKGLKENPRWGRGETIPFNSL
jgi:hypothetical protein